MATWKDLKRFFERGRWELYKNTGDLYYRKKLKNGDVLHTKVSKGTGEISKGMFAKILKQQLKVTKENFNKMI